MEKKEVDVCRRRDNGTHSLKVSLERKLLKKAGQEEVVKLFPRAVSKGIGSASEEAVEEEEEEAEEDVDVERSARLRNCCMNGSGGGLLSKSRTLSVLGRASVTCSSVSFGISAAFTRKLQKHSRMIRQKRADASRETPCDFLTQRHGAVTLEDGYDASSTKERAFEGVGVAASESMPTVKSLRHLSEAPHLFIPAGAS